MKLCVSSHFETTKYRTAIVDILSTLRALGLDTERVTEKSTATGGLV